MGDEWVGVRDVGVFEYIDGWLVDQKMRGD